MYHNTTESTQPELNQYREKAQSQEDKILDWFKTYEQTAGPTKIMNCVFSYGSTPITSVRRAMTNLTDSGDLVKTDKQVKGPYGRPEFIWKLADKYKQQEMF